MALKQLDSERFDALIAAAKLDALCLMECKDKATGEYRAVICGHMPDEDGENHSLFPMAEMCVADPFATYEPPEGVTEGPNSHAG